MSLTITFGILNACLGSLLSALGYCLQKIAHLKKLPEQNILRTPYYWYGLFLLILGTVSAVANLALLDQAVQAPFAALTLVYNAALAWKILNERFEALDALSTLLILSGVLLAMIGAQHNSEEEGGYSQDELWDLWSRNTLPLISTIILLGGVIIWNIHVEQGRQKTNSALLCYGISGGVMAGFTALFVKSTIELVKSGWRYDQVLSYLCPVLIPFALFPQLRFMNQGFAYFGTLRFVPIYQSFIILSNLLCGIIYFNELAHYTTSSVFTFILGCIITLVGVSVLMFKIEEDVYLASLVPVIDCPLVEKARWLTNEDDLRLLSDFEQCQHSIIELLRNATSTIYYSTFLCDFNHPMIDVNGIKVTMKELIHSAVKRNVEVHILYNPQPEYGTSSLADMKQDLPFQVFIHESVSDLGPNFFSKHFSNNSKYAFHHQKYLLVDGDLPDVARIMVTGCDVNSERNGWLKKNKLGYFWHELGVVSSCSQEMFSFIKMQHNNMKHRICGSDRIETPFPLVNGGWREENLMVELIMTAKTSIQLENQVFISGGRWQENRISKALINRVVVGIEKNDNFHALVLSNSAQQDEPSYFTRKYCETSLEYTLGGMERMAKERGLNREQLYSRVCVGRLEHDGVLIKVHSNIIIQDGIRAIRTSSNLTDRSLSHRPCDTEMGAMMKGSAVGDLQKRLIHMYVGSGKKDCSIEDIVKEIQREGKFGNIHCMISQKSLQLWIKFLMGLFTVCSEGATGGNRDVIFETTRCN